MASRKSIQGEYRLDKLPENFKVPRAARLLVDVDVDGGGIITAVHVERGGDGYVTPIITIVDNVDPSNTSAVGQVLISGGIVVGVNVIDGGFNYSANATANITSEVGEGATATVVIDSGVVTDIIVDNVGENYTNPEITFSTENTSATATAVLANSAVMSVTVDDGGTGYAIGTTATVDIPVTVTAVQYGLVVGTSGDKISTGLHNLTFNQHDLVYNNTYQFPIDKNMDAGLFVKRIDGGSDLGDATFHWDETKWVWNIVGDTRRNQSVDITSYIDVSTGIDSVIVGSGGNGYDPLNPPAAVVEFEFDRDGTLIGTGATVTPIVSGIGTYTVTSTGGGYMSVPDVEIGDVSGTGASARALLDAVGEIIVNDGGSGYTNATVTIDGDGEGAIATAVILDGVIISIDVDFGGAGYAIPPTVTITGDGVDAEAIAIVNGVGTVVVEESGTAYDAPTVTITGGDGTGATCDAVIDAVGAVDVVDSGSGYTQSPTIVIDAPTVGEQAQSVTTLGVNPYRNIRIFAGNPDDFVGNPQSIPDGANITIQGLTYPRGDGMNGNVMVSNGNGKLSVDYLELSKATISPFVKTVLPSDEKGIPTIGNPSESESVGLIFSGLNPIGTNAEIKLGVDNTVVRTFGTQLVTGDKTFIPSSSIKINGNLDVQGILTAIDEQTLFVTDNKVVLNSSLRDGDAPKSGASGLQINRGGNDDVAIAWVEGSTLNPATEEGRWGILKGPVGDPAEADPTVDGGTGAITAITVTDGGSGYSEVSPPQVFIRGNGDGATATAVVTGDVVSAVNVTSGGTGYTFAQVIINPPNGEIVFGDYLVLHSNDSGETFEPTFQTDGADNEFIDGVDNPSGFNADKLDGWHGRMYRDATNLNAGTINSDRLDEDSHGALGAVTLGNPDNTTSAAGLLLHQMVDSLGAFPSGDGDVNRSINNSINYPYAGFIDPFYQYRLESVRHNADPNQIMRKDASVADKQGIRITATGPITDIDGRGKSTDQYDFRVVAGDGMEAENDGLKHFNTSTPASDILGGSFSPLGGGILTNIQVLPDDGTVDSINGGTIIQNLEFDALTTNKTYGHVSGINTANLDVRYYTKFQMNDVATGFVPRDFIIGIGAGLGNGTFDGDVTFTTPDTGRIDLDIRVGSGVVIGDGVEDYVGFPSVIDSVELDSTHPGNVDHRDIDMIAGNGLVGGGTIDANRTFDVVAAIDSGIVINIDDIAIDSTHRFHLDHDTISVIAGSGLVGGGAINQDRTLNVGAGNGITVEDDTVTHYTPITVPTDTDNSGGVVIQDLGFDVFGHVVSFETYDLDNRYYTEVELSAVGTDVATSGAAKIGAFDDFAHSDSTNVQDVLVDFDQEISNVKATDITLTLDGDATGSTTFTSLGDAILTVEVVDDSHTHDGRYFTEAESDIRFVFKEGDTMTGELTAPSFNTNSAMKYKEEIMNFEDAFEKMMQIDVFTYLSKGDTTKKRRLGVSAESMAKVAPELVKFDESGDPDSVNYAQGFALLVQAMQEREKRSLSYRLKSHVRRVINWVMGK